MAERDPNTEAREKEIRRWLKGWRQHLDTKLPAGVELDTALDVAVGYGEELLSALERAGRALEQEREKVRALRADYQIAYQSEGWSDVTGCPQCGNRSVAHWCPPVEEARQRLREALSSSPGAAAETDTSG